MEHSLLCFSWTQPVATFVAGYIVTGVLSTCNLMSYDITKYRELLEKLEEASLEIETTLDDFPAGADQHSNERFSQARQTRDLACKEENLVLIEALLGRYQEQRVRLTDVQSDGEDGEDDAVEVEAGPLSPFGITSATMSHYTFESLLQRDPDSPGEDPPTVEHHNVVHKSPKDPGSALRLGNGDTKQVLTAVDLITPREAVSPPRKPRARRKRGVGCQSLPR